MARMPLRDDTDADTGRRTAAILAGVALALAALVAHIGRLAESPAAAAVPALGLLGPGKAGMLRGLPLDGNGLPPAGSAQLAREALAGSPLAYEPFFVAAAAGFQGSASAGTAADAALLREALHRNPRAREAHFLMLRHEVGSGDLKAAISHLAVMNRLTGGIADKMMPAVGMAIQTERQADDAVAGLAPHPELYAPFLRGFSQVPKPPALAVRLVTRLPQAGLADAKVRGLAIGVLVKAQAFAEARAIWGGTGARAELVHSPDFADTKAPPPFNWALAEDTTGVAERAEGGMFVSYFGRVPGPLTSQLLTLAPGTYKARLVYRSEGGSPGALGLQLMCVGSQTPLFDQPLAGAAGTNQALTVTFPIPDQGCKGQVLSVSGRVQESRDPQQAVLRRLDIALGGSK